MTDAVPYLTRQFDDAFYWLVFLLAWLGALVVCGALVEFLQWVEFARRARRRAAYDRYCRLIDNQGDAWPNK